MAKDWIKGATSQNKGKFSAKAKAAGMSTAEYAKKEAGAPGTLGKEAREATTLMHLNKHAHSHNKGR